MFNKAEHTRRFMGGPIVLILLASVVCVTSCGRQGSDSVNYSSDRSVRQITDSAAQTERFVRNVENVDFSSVLFERWDITDASGKVKARDKKPYTVMIYMNGSDLETEEGAATDDLIEILNSGVNSDNLNLVIFTGGASRWQNDVVPENECVLWEVADGRLEKIAPLGLLNMGNAGTLASFIDFGVHNFSADKYGLIMWDHGGGSIAGYGHDENFNKGNLTLLDMNYAFESSVLSSVKLEFLGFDSCLMATSEMAVIASDYADYLIASVDLEPGDGWDYAFLSVFNENPEITGGALGRIIVDSFMDYYGSYSDEILSLSVTDLSKTGVLQAAIDSLMARCLEDLSYNSRAFGALAKRRGGTKTFGSGSPRNNDCDMVDIKSMAQSLSDLFPTEAKNVLDRLEEAVLYSRDNSNTPLGGLSVYYVYGGRRYGHESLELYGELQTNGVHTSYLTAFFDTLINNSFAKMPFTRSQGDYPQAYEAYEASETSEAAETYRTYTAKWSPYEDGLLLLTGLKSRESEYGGLWADISGQSVCLYEINRNNSGSMYAVPAELNGRQCDLIVFAGKNHEIGEVLGVRNNDGLIIQKGLDKIKQGDILAFYYEAHSLDGASQNSLEAEALWVKGESFTVENAPVITLRESLDNDIITELKIDSAGNKIVQR